MRLRLVFVMRTLFGNQHDRVGAQIAVNRFDQEDAFFLYGNWHGRGFPSYGRAQRLNERENELLLVEDRGGGVVSGRRGNGRGFCGEEGVEVRARRAGELGAQVEADVAA